MDEMKVFLYILLGTVLLMGVWFIWFFIKLILLVVLLTVVLVLLVGRSKGGVKSDSSIWSLYWK